MNQVLLAKDYIGEARNISIFLPENSEESDLSGAMALFYTLKKIGKNVNLAIEKISPKLDFLTCASDTCQTTVSIDTTRRNILEMRYEKNENRLKIILLTKGGQIGEEEISLDHQFITSDKEKNIIEQFSSENQPDLLIVLKARNIKNLSLLCESDTIDLENIPIININTEQPDEMFGNVNIIGDNALLGGVLIGVIETVKDNIFDEEIANCLLASIVLETDNLHYSRVSPNIFGAISFLIKEGADYSKIVEYLYQEEPCPRIKLLEKALEKLIFQKQNNLYYISLSSDDFKDAQADHKDLVFVAERLKRHILQASSLLLLWENRKITFFTQGMIWSEDKRLADDISKKFQGVTKKEGFLFSAKEKNITAVQKDISIILKQQIARK